MIKSVNPLSSPMAPGPLFILGSIFLCDIVVGEVNKIKSCFSALLYETAWGKRGGEGNPFCPLKVRNTETSTLNTMLGLLGVSFACFCFVTINAILAGHQLILAEKIGQISSTTGKK